MFHFYTRWKRQETFVFRGYRNETLAWNGLSFLWVILKGLQNGVHNFEPTFFYQRNALSEHAEEHAK